MNANKYIPPFDCDYYGKEFPFNQHVGEHRFIQGDGKTFSEYRPPQAIHLNTEQFAPFETNSYPCGGYGLAAFPQNQRLGHQGNMLQLGVQRNAQAINLSNEPYASGAVNYSTSEVNGINLARQQQGHNLLHDGSLPVGGSDSSRDSGLSLSRKGKHENRERNFVCEVCGRGFYEMSSLTVHSRIHSGDRPFPCDECDKAFASREGLRSHMVTHSQEKRFDCDFCGKKFARKQQMQHHRLIHTGEKPFVCEICQKGFPIMKRLKIHMRAHTDERPYACEICDKRFKSKIEVRKHKRYHTDEKTYLCELCPSRFYAAHNLKKHQRVHNGVKPYHCHACPMRYSNKESFLKHLRTHDEKGESQTSDVNPGADNPAVKSTRPIKIITRKPHMCLICREEFPEQGELEKHQLHHKREKPFPCFICGIGFFRSPNLKIHLSIVHAEGTNEEDTEGKKSDQAQSKGRRSNQVDSKGKRLNQVEPKRKRLVFRNKHFTCQLCDKVFLLKTQLQSHFKTHLRERELLYRQGDFACDECGKRFHNRRNLRTHSYVHVKRKKPHKCPDCSKTFVNKSLLSRHMQVHTGKKNFVCPVCHNRYARNDVLMRHCRDQHTDIYIRENMQRVEVASDDYSTDEEISLAVLQKKIKDDDHNDPLSKDA